MRRYHITTRGGGSQFFDAVQITNFSVDRETGTVRELRWIDGPSRRRLYHAVPGEIAVLVEEHLDYSAPQVSAPVETEAEQNAEQGGGSWALTAQEGEPEPDSDGDPAREIAGEVADDFTQPAVFTVTDPEGKEVYIPVSDLGGQQAFHDFLADFDPERRGERGGEGQ